MNFKILLGLIIGLVLHTACSNPPRPVEITFDYTPSQYVPSWLKPYTINGKTYYPLPSAKEYEEVCLASWYGPGFHGQFSASGEIYNMYEYTAAHKTLPIGTYLLVTNLENGKQTVVRVNDRGPFVEGRCIDLSYAAAKDLGIIGKGTAKVKIIAIGEVEAQGQEINYKNLPDFTKGQFFLQVASFKQKENALNFKKELEKEYQRVEIEPIIKNGIIFYRVQIYLSDDFFEALNLYQHLKKHKFKTAFLVAK